MATESWSQATVFPDMWVDPTDDPRETPAPRGEKDVVIGYLRAYRLTLEMKLQDLDAEQLARRSVPPSSMSLLGLLRHMGGVEHSWFRRRLDGQDIPRLYVDDADFDDAVADPAVVEEAWASWRREVAFAEAWAEGEVDLGRLVDLGDQQVEVRDILVHMVEEYARHCGHADLLRECIDGRIGQ
ncbi:MAG: DinB family protein [Nocardioides sp.]